MIKANRSIVLKALTEIGSFSSIDSITYKIKGTRSQIKNICFSAVTAGALVKIPKYNNINNRSASLFGLPEWLKLKLELPYVNDDLKLIHKCFAMTKDNK